MRTSKRQSQEINRIINETVGDVLSGRRQRDGFIRQAFLNEAGPGNMEDRVDARVLEQEMETTISDQLFDAFDEEIYQMNQKAHRKLVRALFQATKKYGMGWTGPEEVGALLSDMDNDDVSDAQMEFYHDVLGAVNEYGKKLARSLVKVARPEGEE